MPPSTLRCVSCDEYVRSAAMRESADGLSRCSRCHPTHVQAGLTDPEAPSPQGGMEVLPILATSAAHLTSGRTAENPPGGRHGLHGAAGGRNAPCSPTPTGARPMKLTGQPVTPRSPISRKERTRC